MEIRMNEPVGVRGFRKRRNILAQRGIPPHDVGFRGRQLDPRHYIAFGRPVRPFGDRIFVIVAFRARMQPPHELPHSLEQPLAAILLRYRMPFRLHEANRGILGAVISADPFRQSCGCAP
jgi:hypothetical protein